MHTGSHVRAGCHKALKKGCSRGINSLWALGLGLDLNVAAESDDEESHTGLIEQLSGADLASAVDGFDAHLAAAMADFEEESHSSTEEDLKNEPVL
jgi:hypothetical protein